MQFVVSNPVDSITYAIMKTTDLPEHQVIVSGTILDFARLRAWQTMSGSTPKTNMPMSEDVCTAGAKVIVLKEATFTRLYYLCGAFVNVSCERLTR